MNPFSILRRVMGFGKGVLTGLPENITQRDPLETTQKMLKVADGLGLVMPSAMALSTVGPDGQPSCRFVLIKDVDPRGVVFYTNYHSRKAKELDAHALTTGCVFWDPLQIQIRFEGPVERVSDAESDAYFASRPRNSQIGAWASLQSEPLDCRATFDKRYDEFVAKFAGGDVPRPPHWGGYRILCQHIEFWQGRAGRLHDRYVFDRDNENDPWRSGRLYP